MLGDREVIFVTHLIIIIISEESTFPIIVIVFHGCVPEMVVASYAVDFIYTLGKLLLYFFITVSYDLCK